MTKPLVSVIFPVYNVLPYVREALDSVLAQTHHNLDIIVVDDGSTDGSDEVCDEYAAKDERVRVVHQANRGLSAARNVGLDLAKGEYIAFVDSDDTVVPTYVETLLTAITQMDVPCVMCGYWTLDTGSEKWAFRTCDSPCIISAYECFERVLAPDEGNGRRIPLNVWSRLYRRSLFEESGGIRFPEGEVHEDLSVLFKIVHGSRRIGLIPDVLINYRVREESISHTNTATNLLDLERAQERFTSSVREEYPNLSAEADRFLEKRTISSWLRWTELARTGNGDEAREYGKHACAHAVEHKGALRLPADWRHLLKLWLLRASPDLALSAKERLRLLHHLGELERNAVRRACPREP